MKTNRGRFFEDYEIGQVIRHAVPRTVSGGERALYHAQYPARHALYSADSFAETCGLDKSPIDDLAAFHLVFGKTVPDISLNAVANLGYAEGRWLRPVWPGDTLRAESEVIGLKQNSNGKSGVVWVRTTGFNQWDEPVLSYVRWVMVRRDKPSDSAPAPVIPGLAKSVPADQLVIPQGLDFAQYDFELAGEPHRWSDYEIGEKIDHVDGVTIEEAEHMQATRLWQNTAKVHFDATNRPDGKRLIYGGHIISMARALSFNGLANAQMIVGLNAGAHANPCFAGDTLRAESEVIGLKQNSNGKSGVVWVRTTGFNQWEEPVLSYVRWVMVRRDKPSDSAPAPVIPGLAKSVPADQLVIPQGLDFAQYDFELAGEPHRWSDYEIGEKIDHVDGVTIEEAEHMQATRLWQNTAKVHFDATNRPDGKRLIYGGHIISMARALSFNGLANAQMIVGLNAGAHANPCFARDTVRAWSEVLDKADTTHPGVGAIRLRLVATKGAAFVLKADDGKYHPDVLLDLDYWALMPL